MNCKLLSVVLVVFTVLQGSSLQAETHIAIGPSILQSDLGFKSPYGGISTRILGTLGASHWYVRGDLSLLDSQKLEVGDGKGLSSDLLIGRNFGKYLAFAGGAQYSRVRTSAYQKWATLWAVEGTVKIPHWSWTTFGYAAGDAQVGSSIYVRIESSPKNRHGFCITGERDTFSQKVGPDQHTETLRGSKAMLSYLLRIGG